MAYDNKTYQLRFPVPNYKIDSTEEALRWTMTEHAAAFTTEAVDTILRKHYAEPKHVSIVRLDRWADGEISDANLEAHLREVGDHLASCDRCAGNVANARKRRTTAQPHID